MRRLGLQWATGLAAGVIALVLVGAVAASNRSQTPAIHADSSAVVVLVDNRTPVPVEVFLKLALAYHRLGACGPKNHCLYVVPSVQLGAAPSYQVAGLAFGDTEPDDSPMYFRMAGRPNVSQYVIQAEAAPAPEKA